MAKRSITNANCSASATDRGATITSWHPQDAHEALFVTRDANEDAEFHGGIPLCAPWFAKGRPGADVPRPHGLVRWVDWNFLGAKTMPGATRMTWELEQSEVAHLPGADAYPADLHYRYEATFGARLDVALTISSPTEPTIVDQAFHSYFLVNNVAQTRVRGLAGTGFDELAVPGAHDEIYFDALTDDGVDIILPDRIITVTGQGARDVVVWNPGVEYAAGLADFAGDEWARMLCVEIGNVQHNAVAIPAGGSHTMAMTIRIASRRPQLI